MKKFAEQVNPNTKKNVRENTKIAQKNEKKYFAFQTRTLITFDIKCLEWNWMNIQIKHLKYYLKMYKNMFIV